MILIVLLAGFFLGGLFVMRHSAPLRLVKPKCSECAKWVADVERQKMELKDLQCRK